MTEALDIIVVGLGTFLIATGALWALHIYSEEKDGSARTLRAAQQILDQAQQEEAEAHDN